MIPLDIVRRQAQGQHTEHSHDLHWHHALIQIHLKDVFISGCTTTPSHQGMPRSWEERCFTNLVDRQVHGIML